MDNAYGRVKAAQAIKTGLWQNRMMNAKKDWPKLSVRTCGGARAQPLRLNRHRVELIHFGHANPFEINLFERNNLEIRL